MANTFCNHCGQPLPGDARFCTACGKSVDRLAPSIPPLPPSQPMPPAPPAAQVTVSPSTSTLPPPSMDRRTALPSPPHLHWFWVGLLGLATCGIFYLIWYFVHSAYAKKLDPKSNASLYMVFAAVCYVIYVAASLVTLSKDPSLLSVALILQIGCGLVGLMFFYCAYYSIAQTLERELPKYGLHPWIGGVTLFFFHVFYMQGQLSWIARWKDTGQKFPNPPKLIFWLLGLLLPVIVLIVALIVSISGAAYSDYVQKAKQMAAQASSQTEANEAIIADTESAEIEPGFDPATEQEHADAADAASPWMQQEPAQTAAREVYRTSYSCENLASLNPTEAEICHEPNLAEADRQLAQIWSDSQRFSPGEELTRLRREQLAWLRTRDACASFAPCIEDRINERTRELSQRLMVWRAQSEVDQQITDADTSSLPDREPAVDTASKNMNPPRYPPAAVRAGIEGTVILIVDVNAQGKVNDVWVETSSRNRDLDSAAMVAAWKWRFFPGQSGGQPVGGRVRIPVDFNLGG